MPRSLAFAAFAAATIFTAHPVFAQTQGPASPGMTVPRVNANAVWDDRYLYFAFRVDDTDLRGVNTKPMSQAAKDDSIAVYLQTGKERPDAPDSNTNGLIVSAAGGFTFVRGDVASKGFGPRPLFSIKYGVNLEGTINRSDDRDRGYTVTMAIPLDALGIDTKTITPGLELAFEAVARTTDGRLTALVGEPKTEADIAAPKKWARLVLAGENGDPNSQKAGALVAFRVKSKPPLIDGTYREADWPAGSEFGFISADVPKPAVIVKPSTLPGSDRDAEAPRISLANPVVGMERRVLARYLMAFQGDGRKVANPFRGIFGQDGTFYLAEQPAAGIGPWFSTDRPAWHRGELTEMKKTGIDAALISFAGPENEMGPLDEKSLVVLTSALREMATENVPYPELAPSLDARGLVPQNSPKPDLGTPEGRQLLYRAVRRWFDLIPSEFRFRVALPPDASGRVVMAYPFFLDSAEGLQNSGGPEWADEIRKQFAVDFGQATGGTTLLFVGGEGFSESPAFSAVTPLRAGGPGKGPITTFVVQPGVTNPERTADGKEDPRFPFRGRRAGTTYRESWEAATAAHPTWVVIDSWNDFLRGTTVTLSRQYGRQFLDATRIALIQASGLPPRALRWLANDAPRRLRPGQLVSTTVTVMNSGAQILRGADDIALAYRWRRGGEIVAEGPLRLKLSGSLLPSQEARLPIGILAAKPLDQGKLEPLAPGDYTLEIDLSERKDGKTVFFGDADPAITAPLRLPVTVIAVGDAVEIVSTTTPLMTMSGGTYASRVRLRWLGENPLPPDAAQLVYQVLSEDGKDTIYTGTAPLLRALSPGSIETIPVIFRMGDTGAPVPAAGPEFRKTPFDPTGGYQLRWLLTRRDTSDAVPGQYAEHITVYPSEEEAQLRFGNPAPLNLNASATTTVNVTITNRGTLKWAKDGYRVGYHWYYPDGLEMQWKPLLTTALPKDVKPGESITLPMTVRTPDRAGEWILVADLLRMPDVYLSTRLITRANDTAAVPVRVEGGRLDFVDLSHDYNVDGMASPINPKDGDLDGKGATFPAESVAPDAFGIAAYFYNEKDQKNAPVYPSGHFSDASPSARSIAFRYGPSRDGKKNAVTCNGQRIGLTGRSSGLHLAVTAVGGQEITADFVIHYKGGVSKTVSLKIGDWEQNPGLSDPIAQRSLYRRTPQSDVSIRSVLRHRIIPLDITKEVLAIELPKGEHIKIFALTLER